MTTTVRTDQKKALTLCLVRQGSRILLGMKKRGFGAGRWNGFGGKLEPGEGIEDAARRELREEAGIDAGPLVRAGILTFEFLGDPVALEVHVFRIAAFGGEPTETEEMRPRWFETDAIPFDDMWPDDRYWFPLFLAGKTFTGTFVFSAEGGPASGGGGTSTIVSHRLIETDTL